MAAQARTASKLKPPEKKKRTRQNKPYERAAYPGQKIQVDVKFVPSYCVANGQKYYQFTAKDECTRWTYREMYEEHSTHSAWAVSVEPGSQSAISDPDDPDGQRHGVHKRSCWQTKSKHKTLFETALLEMGIAYHRIQIATPRHNGKVERQHRTDELRFYRHMRMYSLEDGRKQLAVYQRQSNDHIMTCLGMQSPNQLLAKYAGVMW